MSTPSVSSYSLAESLQTYPARGPRAANDLIVGNPAAIPMSSTPTGSPAEEMGLDTMDSLAQVTFASQGSDFDPDVSRDGQFIVYASTQHRVTADIYMKAVNGRTITQLTADPAQDVMPAISPDGSRVAFASNRTGSWDIYVMSTGGGQAVQVTSDPAHELHPSWSPDGSRLVFCRLGEVSGRWEMWVADVDQPMPGEFIGYGLFPTWSPVAGTAPGKRDKILFQRSRERGDRAFSVWTVDYRAGDASSPTEIVSSARAAVINPAWSADGTRIVYATVPYAAGMNFDRPANADLWMCGVDGAGRVNLTTGRSVNLMPKWSSDGRIYFVSNRGGIDNIWSVGTDKAIMAATGKMPERTTAMNDHASEAAHPETTETAEVPTEEH
ncbi:MAG: TolB family protein [Phycisphaerales bacterium]